MEANVASTSHLGQPAAYMQSDPRLTHDPVFSWLSGKPRVVTNSERYTSRFCWMHRRVSHLGLGRGCEGLLGLEAVVIRDNGCRRVQDLQAAQ